MLLAVKVSIAALCFLLCLNNITARMGARNANKNITMENEFIFKSFYYINLKLLYFLYKQLLQYQKMHIQSYSLYL